MARNDFPISFVDDTAKDKVGKNGKELIRTLTFKRKEENGLSISLKIKGAKKVVDEKFKNWAITTGDEIELYIQTLSEKTPSIDSMEEEIDGDKEQSLEEMGDELIEDLEKNEDPDNLDNLDLDSNIDE